MNFEEQALCFMAGANSIFTGEKLLTTDNNELDEDMHMFELFGLERVRLDDIQSEPNTMGGYSSTFDQFPCIPSESGRATSNVQARRSQESGHRRP